MLTIDVDKVKLEENTIIENDNTIKTTPSTSVLTNPTNKSTRCKWVAIDKTQHDAACAKCSIVFFMCGIFVIIIWGVGTFENIYK
jgi:hypothetical protein